MTIHEAPSPNHGPRPAGMRITLIVLHSDASPSLDATIDWIGQPAAKVSYHYSVGRTGLIYRHVPDSRRAWHAGVSAWNGETDGRRSVNGFSLGVNLSNRQDGHESFPEPQLAAGAELIAALCRQYGIAVDRIVTHAQCALPPGRKQDPYPGGPFPLSTFLEHVQLLIDHPSREKAHV
jgi:N-acetylmuramoyl-L-alanine amidase